MSHQIQGWLYKGRLQPPNQAGGDAMKTQESTLELDRLSILGISISEMKGAEETANPQGRTPAAVNIEERGLDSVTTLPTSPDSEPCKLYREEAIMRNR